MKKVETNIKDLVVVVPDVYGDKRGFFLEGYNKETFKRLGMDMDFVQDNHSKSSKGVLRGLHYQKNYTQGKLVRVAQGKIYDVAVDVRKGSPTYGKWFGKVLDDVSHEMLYIPEGFAHGFLTLEDETHVLYKATNYYHPEDETGIAFNDPAIGINWSEYIDKIELLVSDKDSKLPLLKDNLFFTEI